MAATSALETLLYKSGKGTKGNNWRGDATLGATSGITIPSGYVNLSPAWYPQGQVCKFIHIMSFLLIICEEHSHSI